MATQRAPQRRPVLPATQGSMQNIRESSQSPSHRTRTMKTHSMPIVPSAMQIFAASNGTQPSSQAQQQQSSPTLSINARRSPPAGGGVTVQRLLPTPPHPLPGTTDDKTPDRPDVSPPLPMQHQPNPHYPRTRPPQFITKYQDQENWEVTDELLADIELADLQKSQQAQANAAGNYVSPYLQTQQQQASPPARDPAVERVRAMERSSPKEPDVSPQRRQQAARESPKARERQPTSPTAPVFPQPPSQSPERRASPYPGGLVTNEHGTGYIQYTRDPSAALRRASIAPTVENRPPIASLAAQTPPLQTIPTRTPDRSLPVQEELEDEPSTKNEPVVVDTRPTWQEINDSQHVRHTGGTTSPTPSSDLNPDGYIERDHLRNVNGRSSRAGHREEIAPVLPHQQDNTAQQRYPDREREHVEEDEVGGFTPRSPTAELPEHPPSTYYSPPSTNARPTQQQPTRRHTRNGSTDQLGLRTFDPSVFQGDQGVLVMNSEMPPQYNESRRQPVQQAPPPPLTPPEHYIKHHQYTEQTQAQYRQPKPTPEPEIQHYDASYIQAYYQSRPEAPVPPTPHTQTAAPSPSPMISGHYGDGLRGKDHPPFSPVPPVGSPYPYPFNHVRRTQNFSGPNRPQVPSVFNPNDIQAQMARQWEVYAQNQQYGNASDSTFSPAATPFEGGGYSPWAMLHTNRTLGRHQDTTSMRSSPSHEPLEPPVPPPALGVKKSQRPIVLRRHRSGRKPPPRVESTQPRDTSPELSSSGEETAGEDRLRATEDGNWSGGTIAPVPSTTDDKDEWVDEDDDDDDLLELEYHQNYIANVEKRRRRWEVGWEAVTQAMQVLDRQTDATMVLMAAPSHSTKLYSATSRSVRRQSGAAASAVPLKEMRSAFSRIASQRRKSRSHKSSLVDRFLFSSAASSGDGSDGSNESREMDLKRALEAALGSLASLRGIYEQREARWKDEMRRISEDRETVEVLLRQVLGENHAASVASPTLSHS
ncbi:hypothetical protein H0H93_008512 [Arthromyces matolae]|nr:hypothetical protein H0H93_008512 [Arthromyces matolae]